jgi:hypothetical protein
VFGPPCGLSSCFNRTCSQPANAALFKV